MDSVYIKKIMRDFGVCKQTVINIIKICLKSGIKKFITSHPVNIGGLALVVQVDETCVCRRKRINSPTSTNDDIKDTIWVVGGIEEKNTPKIFSFSSTVPNRKVETLTNLF